MKKEGHPKYYPESKTTCSCGNVIQAGSTKEHIQIEICAACHPFFTGKMKFIDTAGRVEKFAAKMKKAEEMKNAPKPEKKIVEEEPEKATKAKKATKGKKA